MKILYESLGHAETIDLSTPGGWRQFAYGIVQDENAAIELRERIAAEAVVLENVDEPEYMARFSLLGGDDES